MNEWNGASLISSLPLKSSNSTKHKHPRILHSASLNRVQAAFMVPKTKEKTLLSITIQGRFSIQKHSVRKALLVLAMNHMAFGTLV